MKLEVLLDSIELLEPPFRKTPEGFNPIDVNLSLQGKFVFPVIDPKVFVISYVHQTVVSSPPIGIDDTVDIDLTADDGLQRLLLSVGDDFGIDLAFTKEDPEDGLFSCASTSLELPTETSLTACPEVALIQFYISYDLVEALHLIIIDDLTEEAIIPVDGITVDSQ